MPLLKVVRQSLLLVTLSVAAMSALAEGPYPQRPIRLIVAYAPGGGTDILSRLLAQALTGALGQQVVVDNRPGANAMIGSGIVAKATPDGYTLLMATNGSHGINSSLYREVPYDPVRDFSPVALIAQVPMLLVVLRTSPASSVSEFVTWARAQGGKLNFGSGGTGSTGHLTAEMFNTATGIKASHVPYKSDGPALVDLLAGQFSYIFSNMPASVPYVRAGRFRALAVSTPSRSPGLPDVPTLVESNIPVEIIPWYGVMAPARTPREIVGRLNAEINRILTQPEFKKRLLAAGADPLGGKPEQLTAQIKSDLAKYAKAVKESGAQVE
jgi:tripartite-type tricarboxylate transporter receptor subunit TctC